MFAFFWLMAPAAAVFGVVGTFMALYRRNRAGWNAEEQVMVDRAGAYRSSQKSVGIVERIRDVTAAVQAAAITAMFFGIMWIPSIPIVGLGVMMELDKPGHGPGLATLFGIPGIPLSIAHLVLGIRFTKRSAGARGLARGVAIWSLVHNFVLLAVTVVANTKASDPKGSFELMQIEKAGIVVVAYAFASIGFAMYALYAAKVHEAIDDAGRADFVPTIEGDLPAPFVPAVRAAHHGEAPAWP